MLHAILVAGVTPLQNKDEIQHWDNRPFANVWPERNNRKTVTDITRNRTIKKKNKRVRTAFTTDQLRALEKTFLLTKYINSENRQQLSKKLNIGEKSIKIWFQNRRMKEKRESSESSDSSSETLGSEIMSSFLTTQPAPEAMNDQHSHYETPVYHEPCAYYQLPDFQTYNANETQAPDNVFTPINDSNGFYYHEANPYPAQYSPDEVDTKNTYVYPNQYGNEVYWFEANNIDPFNIYQ